MFQKLFESLKIGPTTIKNRIQVLPHNTLFDFETLIPYCEARARGGAGLIEISLATPTRDLGELPSGPVNAWPYKGFDQRIVPLYQKMATAIHGSGAKLFVQMASAGGNRSAKRGASPVPGGIQRTTSRQLNEQEIEGIVEDHAKAAKLMLDGGIDGVDLHGTHGMLLEEFLSRATNRRTDRYGGSLDNRLRIVLEIISRIRETTKGELAVGMRLDADDKFPQGNDLAEEVRLASKLDSKLDFLNVDLGFEHQYTHLSIAPFYEEPGYQLYAAQTIKQVTKNAVVGATGRIVDPALAEQVLQQGIADIVGMTRALIADPELPNKAREGKIADIRFCLGDNQWCIGNMLRGRPMRCTVNPLIGREGDPFARNQTA
ncbi:MAG: hypothetical protein OK457_02495, partial [Thaumarchaeota archaeon]|nr:hypothetical protein [Nitrososphaerota archaeon]